MSRRRRRKSAAKRPSDLLGTLYPTLDLHGLTGSEAVETSRSWLLTRRREGDRTVRIITGRGLHSVGPAVLPGEIEGLLRSLRDTIVAQYEREPGGGVYRVRLRPVEPPPDRRRPPPRDPALVREAEDALAELGIHATPALVETEIRRILGDRAKSGDQSTTRGGASASGDESS